MPEETRLRLSTPRVAPQPAAEWDEELRPLFEGMAASRGHVLNIFATLAHHPKLLKRWLVFGNHVLGKSTLPARERELVILRTGWLCRAEYEFGQHTQIALDSGLTREEIERATRGPGEEGWSDLDRCLLQAVDELHGDAMIGDATWAALSQHLDTTQLIDLIFAVGQYNLVSMALNSLGVQLDEGVEGFPS